MKKFNVLFTLILFVIAICSCHQSEKSKKNQKQNLLTTGNPNVLLIVADDLGYSDIAPFGSDIQTPNLVRLSKEGILFSNFYVLPTCSPTRAALLSGNDNHIAGMGVMGELIYPDIEGLPGYEGHLNSNVVTIAEILRERGYHTYMTGKWHLGEEDENSPYERGFEETFALMNGGGSHWADLKALSPPQAMIYRNNGQRISSLPGDFYSTKDYTDSIITFIDRNKGDDKPFFAYLSYTAPHDPLHAPDEYIKKYKGMFNAGWDQLRDERLNRLKELGLIAEEIIDFPPNPLAPNWNDLTEEHKAESARDMEVYAAMIDYLDMSIGRLFNYLNKTGQYDNTLVIFFSDNGANGATAYAYPGNDDGAYLSQFNNELDNRGRPNSFVETGAGWAQASSCPFRLFKSFTSQGGIKSPMIIKMPKHKTNIGSWNHSFIHVTDIMPTILDITSAKFPGSYNDRTVAQPIGKSIVPLLAETKDQMHAEFGMGWELFEMKAYIKGNWKILRLPKPFGTGKWQLFDLENDPGEIHDISEQYPDKKIELLVEYDKYLSKNNVYDHNGYFDESYRKMYRIDDD